MTFGYHTTTAEPGGPWHPMHGRLGWDYRRPKSGGYQLRLSDTGEMLLGADYQPWTFETLLEADEMILRLEDPDGC